MVGDVGLDEAVVGGIGDGAERGEVARIGQFVEIDDAMALADQPSHHRASDEATKSQVMGNSA